MTQRFIQWLIAWRWPLLGLGLLIMALAYPLSTQVAFDRSIENMFAPDDPLLVPFRKLKETFGGNEIVLAVYEDPELLDPSGAGIQRLAEISKRLQQAPGVQKHGVLSLAEVNQTLVTLDKLTPFLRVGDGRTPPILDTKSELAARYRDLFAGYTHSHDGRTVAIAVMLIPQNETDVPRRETIDALRATMESLPDGLGRGMLAGEPVMLTDGFRYLEADGERLGYTSLILLAIVIMVCFRSLRWVLIPIVVVQWSLIVTRALLMLAGLKLSMVSSMLTAIVTVVGIATVVHIIVRFREEMRLLNGQATPNGEPPARLALARAGVILLAPIVWSCLTDAVGFGSLLFARVGPVQDFGLMTALGSMLVLPAVMLLVPGLALCGNVDVVPQRAWGEDQVDRLLHRFIHWVEHHPRWLQATILLSSALAITGSFLTQVETDFTKNFRANSPVVESYDFIETRLGGAGVWDLLVPAPQDLDDEYLERVRKLETELRALQLPDPETGEMRPALTKVISLADADEAAHGSRILAAMPFHLRDRGMQASMPTFAAALRNTKPAADGGYYLRIMLRAHERQGAEQKKWLINEVQRLATAAFPAHEQTPPAQVTGFFVLLTNLIDSLLADQWLTFGIASAGIFLMLIVALRSLRLALVALVPNALPIFFALGGLGWLSVLGWPDLKMNMGSAMIAAVSMGLSVDSSIHYILSYKRARRGGSSIIDALHSAQSGVGMAMVFSTLALLVGFSVLATSEFIPTVYFGVLVSLAMLGGMFGNLIALPLLIRMVEGKEH